MKQALFLALLLVSICAYSQKRIRAFRELDKTTLKYGLKIEGKKRWLVPPIYDEILTPQIYEANFGGIKIVVRLNNKYGVAILNENMDSIPLQYIKIEAPVKDYQNTLFCMLPDSSWHIYKDNDILSVDAIEVVNIDSSRNISVFSMLEKMYKFRTGNRFSFCITAADKTYIDTSTYEQIQVMHAKYIIGKNSSNYRVFDGHNFATLYLKYGGRFDQTYKNLIQFKGALLAQNEKDKLWEFINGIKGSTKGPAKFTNAFTYQNQLLVYDGKDTFRVKFPYSTEYALEFTSLRFFNEQLTKLEHGKWLVKTPSNKYGIYDPELNKLVVDTNNTAIFPWTYSPAIVIIKSPGKARLYNTGTNTIDDELQLTDIALLAPHDGETPLFGKTKANKWMYYSSHNFTFDTTRLYDEIKDGRTTEMYFTRQGQVWYATPKYGGRDSQSLSLKEEEEPVSFIFGRSWFLYKNKNENKYGLKLPDGRQIIHPGCDDIAIKGNNISFTIKDHKTTLEFKPSENLQIHPDKLPTLHPDVCPYCSFGSISRKTVIPAEVKTITQGTSVQTLQSERYNATTGNWTKTYSNQKSSRDVIVREGSVSTEIIDCTVCKGTGQSVGTYKWDGKRYLLFKN